MAEIVSKIKFTTAKINVFRKTQPDVEITKPLDREFPPNRCWNCNNYLVAIWDNKEYTQYNFVFNNFGTS